jgi:hypothetical protein
MRLVRALAALSVVSIPLLAARAEAQPVKAEPPPRRFGDASLTVVERFSYLALSGAEQGKAGLARGAGFELRFTMPIGWGAYYRYTGVATGHNDGFDWFSGEFVAGLSRRLLSVGGPNLWSARASARFDFGLGWTQTGTNERCTRSFVPFGTECTTFSGNRSRNVQGDAMVTEARVGGDLGVGPIYIGFDVGIAAYLNVTTGNNSLSLPWLFLAPSGQLKLGVGLPFS